MIEQILIGLQKFFQGKSDTVTGFYYTDLDKYLTSIESNLLNQQIADKINDKEYNALWDTLIYLRDQGLIFKEEKWIIAFHLSVKNIYENMLLLRKKYTPL